MIGIDGLGALMVALVFPLLGLLVLYAIIRMAVRDGMHDALRANELERLRAERRSGEERSS